MTEAEWLACGDPTLLLDHLRGRASDRKLRLFGCECVRRLWLSVDDGSLPGEVILSERYAEGSAELGELEGARRLLGARGGYSSSWAASQSLFAVLELDAWVCADRCKRASGDYRWYLAQECGRDAIDASETEGTKQLERLRDIFGSPFRPVVLVPHWLTETALALAAGIYAERAFDRMPILADALEDAGCDHDDILAHCRGDGPHVRGCWVVDLILGKN